MQKQKTIAKWLAVVLLLTVAVACYVGLNAILKNQNNVVDGADQTQTDNKNNGENNNEVKPIYTTLPRRAENVNGKYVQHVGGDEGEALVDCATFGDKQIVIFKTTSQQYDVKSQGLHLASFADNNLCEVVKIASTDEEYVASALTSRGFLIITDNGQNCVLRLYSSSLKQIAVNTCNRYEKLSLYTHANNLYAIAFDGVYIRALTISPSLEITVANFLLQAEDVNIASVIAYGETTLIFADVDGSASCIRFDKTNGFSTQTTYINSVFVQILPLFRNGEQLFFSLTQTQTSTQLSCLSTSLKQLYTANISSVGQAIILPYDNGVAVLVNGAMHTYCSHLDLLSSTTFSQLESVQKLSYVNGSDNVFYAYSNNEITIYALTDKTLVETEKFYSSSSTVYIRKLTATDKNTKTDTASFNVVFQGSTQNPFAYMCFGKDDIFVLQT